MDKVLIVDDEPEFLESLRKDLQNYEPQFEVLTAQDGKKAIEVLKKEFINVLVTDLAKSKVDGFGLLAHMTRNHPLTPCIVTTENGNPQANNEYCGSDMLRCLKKPFDSNELAGAILKGLDLLDEGSFTKGIWLGNFLQLVQLEQKTCLLEVQSNGRQKGYFCFEKGVLYDVSCNGLKGEEAVAEMTSWNHVKIDFKLLPRGDFKKRIEMDIWTGCTKPWSDEVRVNDIPDMEKLVNVHIPDNGTNHAGKGLPKLTLAKDFELEGLKDEKRMAGGRLSRIVQEILEVPGVNALLIVGKDGLLIEYDGILKNIDMERVGASIFKVLRGAARMGDELGLTTFEALTLESSDALIMCIMIGKVALIILGHDSRMLGAIRLRLRKRLPELAQMF